MQIGVAEIQRGIILSLVITFLINLGVLLYNVNQINNFEQQTAYIIQKEGGTNSTALSEIDKLSKNSYRGYFNVIPVKGNEQKDYGQKISYQVSFSIPLLAFQNGSKGIFKGTDNQSTLSLVGKDWGKMCYN